jgi:protein TonB
MRAPAAARPVAVAPPVALPKGPAYGQDSVSAAPTEKSETPLSPPSTAPAEGSTGANDQAQASTAVTGGAGAAGSDGGTSSTTGGSGGDAAGAPGEAQPRAAASTTLAPRPRGEILPVYPRSAKKAGWQGVVTIRAFIDDTGRVLSAVVLTSSGHQSLDLAALEAVKSTWFEPAVREARPVSSPLLIPVRFQLN